MCAERRAAQAGGCYTWKNADQHVPATQRKERKRLMEVTNEREVGLPGLIETRRTVYDYYQLVFLSDGYPGKRLSEGAIAPHPIYGTYVVADYLAQYRRTKDAVYLDAARRVAHAAVARMKKVADGLAFMYEGESAVSSHGEPFYSGLTQARYVDVMSRLAAVDVGHDYTQVLNGLLASLAVPVELGGVARTTPQGNLVIEEYVHAVPDYTLNGWLTTTLLLGEFARRSKSGLAQGLFCKSVDGICELLSLFDLPEVANSRYRLTGQILIDVGFGVPVKQILNARVLVPGQGSYAVGEGGSRMDNRYLRRLDTEGGVSRQRIGAQVCLLSYPEANSLEFTIDSSRDTEVTISVGESDYKPLQATLSGDRWHVLEQRKVPAGRSVVRVEIPWDLAYLAPYPTSFGKKIGGKNFNQYHFIHIECLRSLHRLVPDREVLARYADRWEGYTRQWVNRIDYQDRGLEPTRYMG